MVHGAEDQGQVEGVIIEAGKIHGVALADGHIFPGLGEAVEDVDVVLHQLHRIHPVAHACEGVGVATRCRAHLQYPHAGLQIPVDEVHGGCKLHMTRPGQQAAFFVVVLIELIQIEFHWISLPKIKNRQCWLLEPALPSNT